MTASLVACPEHPPAGLPPCRGACSGSRDGPRVGSANPEPIASSPPVDGPVSRLYHAARAAGSGEASGATESRMRRAAS